MGDALPPASSSASESCVPPRARPPRPCTGRRLAPGKARAPTPTPAGGRESQAGAGARGAQRPAPHPASPPICHMTTGSHMILIRTGQWLYSTCDVMESMRPQRMKALPFVIYSKFEACYHRARANAGADGLASSRTANRNGPMRGHGRAAVFISAKRAGRARGRVPREPRAGRRLCGSVRARRRLPRFWCGHRGDGRSAAEAEAEAEAEAGAPPREGGEGASASAPARHRPRLGPGGGGGGEGSGACSSRSPLGWCRGRLQPGRPPLQPVGLITTAGIAQGAHAHWAEHLASRASGP